MWWWNVLETFVWRKWWNVSDCDGTWWKVSEGSEELCKVLSEGVGKLCNVVDCVAVLWKVAECCRMYREMVQVVV